MKKLLDSRKFVAAAAYHSGIEEVIWPWCYTGERTNDNDKFYTFAKSAAQAMGMSRYLQSYYEYQTYGEFIDYAYMTQKTFGLTFEVSRVKTPDESELDGIVKRSVDGAMAFVAALGDYADGRLTTEKAPRFTLRDRNPFWVSLGMRLE